LEFHLQAVLFAGRRSEEDRPKAELQQERHRLKLVDKGTMAMSQLGIVTYNIAKDWDLPTILTRLEKLGYEGVELRTTHAHKVEVNLAKDERELVRKRFEDSPVQLAGLGSAFEYQAADPAVVRKNIDETKEYVRLAHDVGSPGVKVRPNGIPKGADLDVTLRQIGRALHEIGDDADDFGVAIRVEVHGGVTQDLDNFAKIMKYADHPNVYACWNSNPGDVKNGSIKENFALIAPRVHEVHLRDLTDEAYPWRELFGLLNAQKYEGFTLAEIPESPDPERVLRYFRSLWLAYQPRG
jgi:sugar phosphate isomerase/epimerase